MDILSQVRAYSYLSAVLSNGERDPFCRSCNSFLSSLTAVEESIRNFEIKNAAEIQKLPNGQSLLFYSAKSWISGIRPPAHAATQKGKGNCRLPAGICFLKSSLRLLQQIERIDTDHEAATTMQGRRSEKSA